MISGIVRVSPEPAKKVSVRFEGQPLDLATDGSLAAALLEAGISHFRDTPNNVQPRGPFCLMGVCFDCLMVIDGMPNTQACMVKPREGMVIERQSSLPGPIRPWILPE